MYRTLNFYSKMWYNLISNFQYIVPTIGVYCLYGWIENFFEYKLIVCKGLINYLKKIHWVDNIPYIYRTTKSTRLFHEYAIFSTKNVITLSSWFEPIVIMLYLFSLQNTTITKKINYRLNYLNLQIIYLFKQNCS